MAQLWCWSLGHELARGHGGPETFAITEAGAVLVRLPGRFDVPCDDVTVIHVGGVTAQAFQHPVCKAFLNIETVLDGLTFRDQWRVMVVVDAVFAIRCPARVDVGGADAVAAEEFRHVTLLETVIALPEGLQVGGHAFDNEGLIELIVHPSLLERNLNKNGH